MQSALECVPCLGCGSRTEVWANVDRHGEVRVGFRGALGITSSKSQGLAAPISPSPYGCPRAPDRPQNSAHHVGRGALRSRLPNTAHPIAVRSRIPTRIITPGLDLAVTTDPASQPPDRCIVRARTRHAHHRARRYTCPSVLSCLAPAAAQCSGTAVRLSHPGGQRPAVRLSHQGPTGPEGEPPARLLVGRRPCRLVHACRAQGGLLAP